MRNTSPLKYYKSSSVCAEIPGQSNNISQFAIAFYNFHPKLINLNHIIL